MAETPVIDLEDVQGLVFTGWGQAFQFAGYVFVRCPDIASRARGWLASLEKEITWARPWRTDRAIQVALSTDGLAALGVPSEVVDRFPQEAKVNMNQRSRTLGDEGDNDPQHWTLWRRGEVIHAIVMVFGSDETERDALIAEERRRIESHGGAVVAVEKSWQWRPVEPFGFVDGLSQPWVQGAPAKREPPPKTPDNEIPTGEILLGYENAYGFKPKSPEWAGLDLGKNGTYLVFRKLRQHVPEFWTWFRDRARELAGQPPVPRDVDLATHWLAARAMGRWRNGSSVLKYPDAPGEDPMSTINDFQYLDTDPHGVSCPIGSHVRRANPRDARGGTKGDSLEVVNRHRILRRGRAYGRPIEPEEIFAGKTDSENRGLLFVSLQASIARGFEFIQQTWNVNPGFHGLHGEPDPITGPGKSPFTIPARPLRIRFPEVPRFVTVEGGGYTFLPSRKALGKIASG